MFPHQNIPDSDSLRKKMRRNAMHEKNTTDVSKIAVAQAFVTLV